MTYTFEENVEPLIAELDDQFKASFKRVNKERQPTIRVAIQNLNELITIFNEIRKIINANWNKLDEENREIAQEVYDRYTAYLKRGFERQSRQLVIEDGQEVPLIPQPDDTDTDTSTDTESEDEQEMAAAFISLATKILPVFDGKAENLQTFTDALNLLSTQVGEHADLAIAIIKTKLTGTARTLITDEATIPAIIATLGNRVKGESSAAILAKLENVKQGGKSANVFIKEIEDLAKMLEASYISKGIPADTAMEFATQSAVKAVSKNASNDNVKLIVQAGHFQNMNDLVAKFVSTATEAQSPASILYTKGNYRGNNRGNRGNRGYRGNRGRGNNNNHQNNNTNGGNNNQNRGQNRGRNNNNNRNNGGYRGNNRNNVYYAGQGNGQSTNQQDRLGENQQ